MTAVCALADHEAETGNPKGALALYEQLLDKVMATKPDALGDLRDTPKLSLVYSALAALYQRTGDSAKAEIMKSRRVELWRHWQRRLPQNSFVGRQLQAAQLP